MNKFKRRNGNDGDGDMKKEEMIIFANTTKHSKVVKAFQKRKKKEGL